MGVNALSVEDLKTQREKIMRVGLLFGVFGVSPSGVLVDDGYLSGKGGEEDTKKTGGGG